MSEWEQVFVGLVHKDIYFALLVLFAFLIFSWLIYYLVKKTVKGLVEKSGTHLDNIVLETLEKPVFIALGFLGLYIALLSLPFIGDVDILISKVIRAAFIVLGIYAGIRTLDVIFKWYAAEIATRTKTALDDTLIAVLRIGIPILGGLLGIVLLLDIFGFPVQAINVWLSEHGARLALILGISVLAFFVLGISLPKIVERSVGVGKSDELPEEVKKRANTLSGVLITSGHVLIIVVAIFMLLSEIGVNIAPMLAGAGVAGVAIGFGAQSLIKDIIAGIFIISDNQYRVGDVARIADIAGLVEEINLRRTVLRDLDGIVHFVPNGEIKVASNFTRGWSRVNLNISVAYGEDLDRVITVINRVGSELAEDPAWAPLLITAPKVLRVDKLGDSGIDIKITGDTKPIQQWAIMGELRLRLKRTFDQEGIEIPWPHTKVYFGNSPEKAPENS